MIYVHLRPLRQVIMQRHEGRRHITKVHKNYGRKNPQEKVTEAEKHLSRKLLTTATGGHLTGLYICEMGPGKRLISKHIGMHHTITGRVLF